MPQEGESEFRLHVEGCFLEIVPEQRLVWTTCLGEGWRPVTPWLGLTAIMTFVWEGQATRHGARVLHKNAADSRKHADLGFQDGWGTTLDQLASFVERPEEIIRT